MRKQTRRIKQALSVMLSLLMLASVLLGAVPTALALETVPPPIDPQSWTLLRDTNWSNFKPNPVIDWMTEHNPVTFYNPSRHAGEQNRRNTKINGAIILVDFWDKPFLMLGEKNSDLFGWHNFNEFDTYLDYLGKIQRGAPVVKNPQRVVKTEKELLSFWGIISTKR